MLVGRRPVTVAAECNLPVWDRHRRDVSNSPNQVGSMAFVVWNEWFTIHQLQRHNIVPVEDHRSVRWEKPGVRWIKCNVDAALVVGSGVTSTKLTQWQQPFYSIVEDETLTLLHAMKYEE
ncbi:hypothetical protein A2U01_0007078 [Trifolium medium]|uniref:Uncharacterized protein n=1 Tax=Trifolium medium TaxID=97028 RepID=A0A392MJ03_9FABA|nr:hypothetical protein [Trifolium medium]